MSQLRFSTSITIALYEIQYQLRDTINVVNFDEHFSNTSLFQWFSVCYE